MKYYIPLVTAALLASLLTGCSKHRPAAPKVTDLGVIEVSDGSTNRLDMGDGRVCVVRSFILKDPKVMIGEKETTIKGQRVAMTINIEQPDSVGVTRILSSVNVMGLPDQQVGFADGNAGLSVSLKPHIKQ